jgi:hypothetical protein
MLLGIYIGLLGYVRSIFEILQGNGLAEGISIQVIDAPCQTLKLSRHLQV